jgi:hypothetical protein
MNAPCPHCDQNNAGRLALAFIPRPGVGQKLTLARLARVPRKFCSEMKGMYPSSFDDTGRLGPTVRVSVAICALC